jgi:hypothetical protein
MSNSMLKYIFGMLLLCYLCACNQALEAPVSPAITNVMIYNGSTTYISKSSRIFVDTAFLTERGYNDINGGPMGVLNTASYNWVDPGKHRIAFSDTSGTEKVFERFAVLEKSQWYTFYLADSLGYYDVLMSEENMLDRPETKARIRLVQLCPDSGPVTFYIDKDPVPGLEKVAYKTITPFIAIDPQANPSFRIKYASEGEEGVALVRKAFTIYPGRSYTFILRGYVVARGVDPNTTINLSAIMNF